MKSIWQADARRELHERLRPLTPDRRRVWGKMSAPEMVAHLAASLKMALGELPVASRKTPLRYPVLKHLIIYVLPWPQGAPTAPELIARAPGEWTTDVRELVVLIDRFRDLDANAKWPDHPAFGALSGRTWGALIYRHMDHHFRQFAL